MDSYVTGRTIKALREKRGLTQAALANRIGVSDKAVSKWETGEYDLVSSIAKEEEKHILAKAKIAKILTGEYSNATLSDWVNKKQNNNSFHCGKVLHSTLLPLGICR